MRRRRRLVECNVSLGFIRSMCTVEGKSKGNDEGN